MAGFVAPGTIDQVRQQKIPGYNAPYRPTSMESTYGSAAYKASSNPTTKTAYDQWGNAVDIAAGQPVSQWQPDTLYAGTHYFEAPPPQNYGAPTTATQAPRTSSASGAATSATPTVNRSEQLSGLMSMFGDPAAGTGAFGASGAGAGGGSTIRLPTLPPPQNSAQPVLDQARARAREKIGSNRLAAVKSFQSAMDNRGLTGSMGRGLESGGIADIVRGGASDLSDFDSGQAMDDIMRAREVEDRNVAIAARVNEIGADQSFKSRENQLDREYQAQELRKRQALEAFADFYKYAY